MNDSIQKTKLVRHVGAYFDRDDEVVKKIALLRIHLDMNNAELIKLAIDDLYNKEVLK